MMPNAPDRTPFEPREMDANALVEMFQERFPDEGWRRVPGGEGVLTRTPASDWERNPLMRFEILAVNTAGTHVLAWEWRGPKECSAWKVARVTEESLAINFMSGTAITIYTVIAGVVVSLGALLCINRDKPPGAQPTKPAIHRADPPRNPDSQRKW